MSSSDTEVVVIGAGPAGLAASRELSRRGVPHLVLERGERPAHTWENLYDSLTLHTGKHLSSLPGQRFERGVPLFPRRSHFVDYLHGYAERNRAPLQCGCAVSSVRPAPGGWVVGTDLGTLRAPFVIMATGIVANPRIPVLPGRDEFRGRVLHSAEYRRPAPFVGRRVLVVGVGNSGGEIGSELALAGAEVTVAVRSGANVVPLRIGGLPVQYASLLVRQLPRRAQEAVVAAVGKLSERRRGPPVLPRPSHSPLDAIPLIGFHLVDAIREGLIQVRGALAGLTREGVLFADGSREPFDDVILATGFEPALGPLAGIVRRDERGFALRKGRVRSAEHAGLFFVGHVYDSLGGLYNISRDAPVAAEMIALERV
jgi:indole-3-pyruvate monooxygenase